MKVTIQEVIDKIKDWKDKDIKYRELGGGITNHNYFVEVNGNKYVVRIPGEKTDIFINRENELDCSIEAGKTGVAPKVVYYLKPENVSVIEFIDGKTLKTNDIAGNPEIIKKIVTSIKKVHEKAVFNSVFNPFNTIRKYLIYVKDYNAPMPSDINQLLKKAEEIESKIKAEEIKLTACHNDLLSENFMYDGKKIWIIDWEYGGNGDPFFDLADFAVEHPFSDKEEEIIIKTYCGKMDEKRFARMIVYKAISDLWWSIWAMIQSKISTIDFNYYDYGSSRFQRMRDLINSHRFRECMTIL